MPSKMKKKNPGKRKETKRKSSILAISPTISVVLLMVSLVFGTSFLVANKEKLWEMNDWFNGVLSKMGLLHLSDDDMIALASMQAMTCAIDVVAYYNNPEHIFPADNTAFDNVDSCNVDLFGSEDAFTLGNTRFSYDDSNIDSGDSITGGPQVEEDSEPTEGTTPTAGEGTTTTTTLTAKTINPNTIECGGTQYTITIDGVDSTAKTADFEVVSSTTTSDTLLADAAASYKSFGTIRINAYTINSANKVYGNIICGTKKGSYVGDTTSTGISSYWRNI